MSSYAHDLLPVPRAFATPAPEEALESGPVAARPVASEKDLAALIRENHELVWRTLRRLGVDGSRIDDAAQETFIVVSRKLDAIEPGRMRAFVVGVAVRIAANQRRQRERHPELPFDAIEEVSDSAPRGDELLHQKRLRQALDELLDSFPADIRSVFVLFELEGLTMLEIADAMQLRPGTVASRLRRGRELFATGMRRFKARGLAGTP